MKILILAADNNDKIEEYPSCFNATVGAVNLLEYYLRLFNLLGIDNNSITIAIGKDGVWKNKTIDLEINVMLIDNLGYKSFSSLKKYCNELVNCEDMLIINGNSFFELKDLEKLIVSNESSVLIEKRNNYYTKGLELIVNQDYIVEVREEKPSLLPWLSYYGAMLLKENDVFAIKNSSFCENMPYLNAIVNFLHISLKKIDVNDNYYNHKSLELIGGSFAGLHKINLVKKYAGVEGNDKLIMEIEWLKKLPNELKDKFPKVIDYSITPSESWFTMPYYNLENLRKKIISGKFSTPKVLFYIEKILDYAFKNLYTRVISSPDENWVKRKHFDRFYNRIKLIQNITPFNKILNSKYIIINGKKYLNLKELILKLENYHNTTKLFQPENLIMIHGDLHFQNMLIDDENEDFLLADPRGELNGSDIYYDLGKLWHSFNGLYDLIHTDISKVKLINESHDNISYEIFLGGKELLDVYNNIKSGVFNLIYKYPIVTDYQWLAKIKFSEVMHFSSLMWFHLKYDKIENRALSLYLQAIILADELLKELECNKNE
ncbi:hypothetical protein FYH41_00670 [Campylobacter jejuni]|nr:hypothetical protein [Campylobacter jejuni]